MGRITSEKLVERLAAWGVDTVFGLPGDGINGIMEGLRRHQDKVKFFLVHHEEAAAFMASGYAKSTGRLGVCLATSGPGGVHLLNGLYDAAMDHAPVLAITGMQETSLLGTGYQQEVHLDRLYMDLTVYNQLVDNPAQLPAVLDIAVRAALSRRGVAHLTIANDIQVAPADADPWEHVAQGRAPSTAPIYLSPPGCPKRSDLTAAAEVLNAGTRTALLVGVGAMGAGREVEQVADCLAAPVIKTLPGKAVISDDSPFTTGGIGLLGTTPSQLLIDDIDTLFMIGTNFPYTKHLPAAGSVRVVQVDRDPERVGTRIPTEVPLVGDATETLRELIPLLNRNSDRSHLEKYQSKMADWRKKMADLCVPRDPIAPQYLMCQIDELASEDAILTCDSGTIASWAARHWTIRGDRRFYLSGNLATMAPGLPYAVAMQHAFPGRQVIAFVGDGGFAMLMAEFLTAVQHKLPITVVVDNNNSLAQIWWEQMVLGYPEHGIRFAEPAPDFSQWARAAGGHGAKVTQSGDLRGAISEALHHDGPALVDVDVDPNEPPMPGKVEYQQAKKFAEAMVRGQGHKKEIAANLFKDRVEQLFG